MTDDGGPAFPVDPNVPVFGKQYPGREGMRLRDWFAGQALAGICAADIATQAGINGDGGRHVLAKAAYWIADAMLAERANPDAEREHNRDHAQRIQAAD